MKASLSIAILVLATVSGATAAERRADAWNLSLRIDGDVVSATRSLAGRQEGHAERSAGVELRTERVSASLAGKHVFLREYLAGWPILNGGFAATFDPSGIVTSYHDRRARATDTTVSVSAEEAIRSVQAISGNAVFGEPTLVGWIHEDGVARLAWRVVSRSGYDEFSTLVDASKGLIVLTEPLFFAIDGRVFDPNPVTTLNQPALRDNDNSAEAVPDSAYSIISVNGLLSDDSLVGDNVTVTELEAPVTTRAKPSSGLMFDRSQNGFEEVMAYVHIDRSQRYIQSLGFTGSKAIVPYSLPVDAHGVGGDDNSYYRFSTPGRGRLVFGDGGVDDAEDADIILHEYGHAIQDSIVPAGFTGSAAGEPRAMGEGFGDYWAFSSTYAANVESGADPFCVGDWDALCGEGSSSNCGYSADATCLRRVDSTKTMDDYIRLGGNGTEHSNGQIWSSALRAIFMDAVAMSGIEEGRRTVDRTILESHFGMPPNPTFRTAAIRLLDADRRLNSARLEPSICGAMTLRKILADDDCNAGLRGEVTMIQSPTRGAAIPDNSPDGVNSTLTISDLRAIEAIYVAVDVRHPRRGDLRLTLISPGGTSVVIQTESSDSAPDIVATYGLDTQPTQSFGPLLGTSAAGTWTLNVADNRGLDEGELVNWSLLIRFAGDTALPERGRPGSERLHVSVSGTTAGAAGTKFVSDLRILNVGTAEEAATLIYTATGADGLTSFKALSLSVAPGQVVALDDVVSTAFRSSGTGSIEVRGNPALLITSRIYNDQPEGTFGQFFAATSTAKGISTGDGPLNVVALRNTTAFRSNLGITEVNGGIGAVEIRLFGTTGALLSTESRQVLPYGHDQFALFGGIGGFDVDAARAEIRVSSGDARVIAYGSSIDNLSGDAVFIPATTLPRTASSLVVPAVIHSEGAVGTNWRSDLWIFNGDDEGVTIDLTLHPSGGGDSDSASVTIGPGELLRLDDVVSTMFSTFGTGSIVVTGDDLSRILVTSRAWNDAAAGSFGQFIEAQTREQGASVGGTLRLSHLDSDDTFRTNIGLTEASGSPVSARVTLLDASGGITFTTTVDLEPHDNRQLSLAQLGAPVLRNGQARIEVLSGTGRLLAYASVVDNRTGDATYVPGR